MYIQNISDTSRASNKSIDAKIKTGNALRPRSSYNDIQCKLLVGIIFYYITRHFITLMSCNV